MESIWMQTKIEKYEMLKGSKQADVCVIGGGLAGVLCAYQLSKTNKKVILLEAARLGSGQTGKTTAKITTLRDCTYANCIKDKGIDSTKIIVNAYQSAIDEYEAIINDEKIDCDFKRVPAYLYAKNDKDKLKEEYEALIKLGINVSYHENKETVDGFADCICLENQAQFNPIKFIKGLNKNYEIYENSFVNEVKGNVAYTSSGQVEAKEIVFCTHYPICDIPGFYFTKMHQQRSYVILLKNIPSLNAHYFGIDKDGFSFRFYQDMLLLGGVGHRSGENSLGGEYEILMHKAKELYPSANVKMKWSAQDCMTLDNMAYVGKYSSMKENWYVVTGFNLWGMAMSMVASRVIKAEIMKEKCEESEVFLASRHPLSTPVKLMSEGIYTLKNIAKEYLSHPTIQATQLENGHGGVVDVDGEKVGVYKNDCGKITIVSLKCPHLGCQLNWNPSDKSWDCPCHGSRFDYMGKLIDNPATQNIKIKK